MVKDASVRKARLDETKRRIAEERKAELAKMPMNAYMAKGTDLGKSIAKFMLSDFENVTEIMRQIKIKYVLIRDSINSINRLKTEMLVGECKDDTGKVISVDVAKVAILRGETSIQGYLRDIRTLITQKLITMISDSEFTEGHFESYLKHVQDVLLVDGYVLFPDEYQMLPLL